MAHRLAQLSPVLLTTITSMVLGTPASATPAPQPTAQTAPTRQLRDNRLVIHGQVLRRVDNHQPWVVRCVAGEADVPGCRYRTLTAAISDSRPGDLVLLGRGADLNLRGATLTVPPRVQLLASRHAPVLASPWGPISLANLLPKAITPVRHGVLNLTGGNRVVGLNFSGVSLRNRGLAGGRGSVEIRDNHFQGSYTDNPGGISPLALPTLWLQGGEGAQVVGNWFERPEVRSLVSALGWNDNTPADRVSVCGNSSVRRNKRTPGVAETCLSGNAIRLDHTGPTRLVNNRITEALDEAIRIENPRGPIEVTSNQIEAMRQGPDSNMQAAIFTRVTGGTARVSVRDNLIKANATGILEPADGPQALRGGLRQRLEVRNLIDPIEIGLCRGDQTFPRADDKYGDPAYGSGDCQPSAQLRLDVVGNRLHPGRQSDADGIDYNVGRGGRLLARTLANHVTAIGEGNSAYTVDLRGNGQLQDTIRANHLVADNGISLEIGNLNGAPVNTGRLKAEIESNTILADTQANPSVIAGKQQSNTASGVEIEVQGSNTPSAGFGVNISLRNNRITVTNQSGNPGSDAQGVSFGSVLFKAKDGSVLQQGRLSSGTLALNLTGNRVTVTRSPGSGSGHVLHEVIEQGHFQKRLHIGPGNIWLLNGSVTGAIQRSTSTVH